MFGVLFVVFQLKPDWDVFWIFWGVGEVFWGFVVFFWSFCSFLLVFWAPLAGLDQTADSMEHVKTREVGLVSNVQVGVLQASSFRVSHTTNLNITKIAGKHPSKPI